MPNVTRRNRAQAVATGELVTALMRERGISAAALADSVGIQRSTLENYCGGRRIPLELLTDIAERLDTTVAYLLTLSDDSAPPSAVG